MMNWSDISNYLNHGTFIMCNLIYIIKESIHFLLVHKVWFFGYIYFFLKSHCDNSTNVFHNMYMEFLLKRVKQNKFDECSTAKLCTASLLENMKTSYALFQEMHFLIIWKSRVISRIMLKFKMTDQLTSLCQAKNAKNLWRHLQIIYVILVQIFKWLNINIF